MHVHVMHNKRVLLYNYCRPRINVLIYNNYMHIKLHFLDQILYLLLHETVSICDVWSGKKREIS